MGPEIIWKYFPHLSPVQRQQIEALDELYRYWNAQINVISRKDIDNLYLHHILHSMCIGLEVAFAPQAHILDLGTGGGFPGIPLAILFPQSEFLLIDGTGKKIKVVKEIAKSLVLPNVRVLHCRAEHLKGEKFDFIVTRAVATLDKLLTWSRPLLKKQMQHALPNGLLALKGGAVEKEIKALPRGCYATSFPLSEYVEEPWFQSKYLVYVQG